MTRNYTEEEQKTVKLIKLIKIVFANLNELIYEIK